MKRVMGLMLALSMALAALPMHSVAQESGRRLTLMVYLCGSNLESEYGSATSDIMEMTADGSPGSDVSVLLMTGGARQWYTGYDSARCRIQELVGRGGVRTVWDFESMNMGSSETLTRLLRYGVENYPADDYALILWDHGGGPLEGVCWDEMFSLDNLSMDELCQGIADAALEKKLAWIGFDACLMGSLEVAAAMAPYADYMIASQETEPAGGWNYSFISGLTGAEGAVETARRIVDGYMQAKVLGGETLTLSCLDLSQTTQAVRALGDCFALKAADMDENSFARLAGERAQATAFGAPLRAFGDGGYDLVDLKDLTDRLDLADGAKDEIDQALSSLVVYSRSNREGANGVSVYHPCYNKDKYRDKWRTSYKRLDFSESYTRYIDAYGRYLLGDDMTDWSGLGPVEAGEMAEGRQTFSLQLSPEQAKNVVSAQLLVMMSTTYVINYGEESYALVGAYPATVDGNGVMTATYDGRALFLEAGKSYGPLGYVVSPDGDELITSVTYVPKDGSLSSDNAQDVYYYVDASEDGNAQIRQARIEDSVTGMLTNRMTLSEDDYRGMYVWYPLKELPQADSRGLLPEYALWDDSRASVMWTTVQLPAEWHFDIRRGEASGAVLWAAFEITDVQQNTWCTPLAPVENASLIPVSLSGDTFETEDARLKAAVTMDISQSKPGIWLEFELENKGEPRRFYIRDLRLNGTRQADTAGIFEDVDDHSLVSLTRKGRATIFLEAKDLLGLGALETVGFTLEAEKDYHTQSATALELALGDCDVSGIAPMPPALASANGVGCEWELFALERDFYGLKLGMRVKNTGSETLSFGKLYVLVNGGVQLWDYATLNLPKPGMECVYTLSARSRGYLSAVWDSFKLDKSEDNLAEYYLPDVLDSNGVTEIRDLSLMIMDYDHLLPTIALPLAEPVPLPQGDLAPEELMYTYRPLCDDGAAPALLVAGTEVEAWIDHLLVGYNGICLSLTLRNLTDHAIILSLDEALVNGINAGEGDGRSLKRHMVAPGAVTRASYLLDVDDQLPGGLPVNSLRLFMRCGRAPESAWTKPAWTESAWAALHCPEGTALSAPGGAVLSADALGIEPAALVPILR